MSITKLWLRCSVSYKRHEIEGKPFQWTDIREDVNARLSAKHLHEAETGMVDEAVTSLSHPWW